MYISSALNSFRSICQISNVLCIAIYIRHKELHYYIPEDCCISWEKVLHFKSLVVCNVKKFISSTFSRFRRSSVCFQLHRQVFKCFCIKDSLGMKEFPCKRFFFFRCLLKKFFFQNLTCHIAYPIWQCGLYAGVYDTLWQLFKLQNVSLIYYRDYVQPFLEHSFSDRAQEDKNSKCISKANKPVLKQACELSLPFKGRKASQYKILLDLSLFMYI